MEKVIYTVSFAPGTAPAELGERVRGEVAARLLDLGVHRLSVNVADHLVAPAAGLRMASSPTPADTLVCAWIDSATDHLRAPFDQAVAIAGGTQAAYLVTESVPLAHQADPASPGGRVDGLAQVAFFRRPEGQPVDEWLGLWLDHHTQVAIDTQDTFSYVQNVVTRVLTPGATPWHAIVEECFPSAAMADPAVFFDAVGDPERLARHQQVMFESVQRFIDLSSIDVIPTSRYDL